MKTITAFTSIESFSTERLIAFKITVNDLDKFIMMHSDMDVMATLGGLRTVEQTKENEVITYDPKWPDYYKQESQRLQKALGDHLREIYHIGSTAIPNMPAKPVVDIMLVCENLDAIGPITQALNGLNYYYLSRSFVPHRSFF